jgi:hypothetical protein
MDDAAVLAADIGVVDLELACGIASDHEFRGVDRDFATFVLSDLCDQFQVHGSLMWGERPNGARRKMIAQGEAFLNVSRFLLIDSES